MEHYYVVSGNEYGIDILSKKNFTPIDKQHAYEYFEKVKYDDFGCMLMYVNSEGKEKTIETFYID